MRNLDKSILRMRCLKFEVDLTTTRSAGKEFQAMITRFVKKNFLVFSFARGNESL